MAVTRVTVGAGRTVAVGDAGEKTDVPITLVAATTAVYSPAATPVNVWLRLSAATWTSSSPSFTVYPVIVEPPSSGVSQVTVIAYPAPHRGDCSPAAGRSTGLGFGG